MAYLLPDLKYALLEGFYNSMLKLYGNFFPLEDFKNENDSSNN
tara:strand:+ start:116034 stop:116162 length:129 start_codon:yes stop_codon:yes gene_type:complete